MGSILALLLFGWIFAAMNAGIYPAGFSAPGDSTPAASHSRLK